MSEIPAVFLNILTVAGDFQVIQIKNLIKFFYNSRKCCLLFLNNPIKNYMFFIFINLFLSFDRLKIRLIY